MFEVRQVI